MLNFKKNGIFTRRAEQEGAAGEPEPDGGILAVWGSPGSGKTVAAVKLAKYLADQKRNTVLVLCDATAPMLPSVCPPSELDGEHSLGSILAAAHVSEPLIKYNLITLKRHSHLTLLGMKKGENEYTYPPYSETQAKELLEGLRGIAPFVVVDCGSYIANDILSAVSLMEADSVLRLATADLKSVSYSPASFRSCATANGMRTSVTVASNVKPCRPESRSAGPRRGGLYAAVLAGAGGSVPCRNLLEDLAIKDSRPFRKEIEKICKEVFCV
jgi:MinD-like ATPase involved in chromosome partitioning or flagellar assembly